MGSRTFTPDFYEKLLESSEEQQIRLLETYAKSQSTLIELMQTAANSVGTNGGLTLEQIATIQNQVDRVMGELNQELLEQIPEIMKESHHAGQYLAAGQLDRFEALKKAPPILGAGAVSFNSFAVLDQMAIRSISEDTYRDLATHNQMVSDSFKKSVRKYGKDAVLNNVTSGLPFKASAKEMKAFMEKEGFLDGYTKKNGAKMKLDTYCDLVVRTKSMQAHNDGTLLLCVDNGVDLVKVSTHARPSKMCAKLEGKIYSISGTSTKHPALKTLPNGGPPFHPNCRHVVVPYIVFD